MQRENPPQLCHRSRNYSLAGHSWLVCETSLFRNLIRHVPPSHRERATTWHKKQHFSGVPFPSSRLAFISDWTCSVMLDNKIERFSSSVPFSKVECRLRKFSRVRLNVGEKLLFLDLYRCYKWRKESMLINCSADEAVLLGPCRLMFGGRGTCWA